MKNFRKKTSFLVGCSTICLAHSIDQILTEISPQTRDLLSHLVKILEQNGVELKNLDDQVYYAAHLALTHIHIQQLKTELRNLEKDLRFFDNLKEDSTY